MTGMWLENIVSRMPTEGLSPCEAGENIFGHGGSSSLSNYSRSLLKETRVTIMQGVATCPLGGRERARPLGRLNEKVEKAVIQTKSGVEWDRGTDRESKCVGSNYVLILLNSNFYLNSIYYCF